MFKLFGLLLSGHVLTAKVVAEILGVQEAAARRHLHRLAQLPGAIKEKRGGAWGVKLPTLVAEPPPHAFDVVAGCLLSSFAGALKDTKFHKHAAGVRSRLLARSATYRNAEHLDRKFWFVARGGEKELPRKDADLACIVEALLESRWIRFKYRNARGELSEKRVRPLTLALNEQQFYILGFYADSEQLRPFRFARMSAVRCEGRFVYPAAYDPSKAFEDSFGIFVDTSSEPQRVRVKIDGELREHAASHRWHRSQQPAGEDSLEFLLRICPEVKRWLLWLGPEGEVLHPPELRAEIRDRLERALARYAPNPGVARIQPTKEDNRRRASGTREARVRG